MGLEDREKKRKSSGVIAAIAGMDVQNEIQPKKTKETSNKDRVQKSYYLDKDLFKALQKKSMIEEINLTEAVNRALRKGLEDYL